MAPNAPVVARTRTELREARDWYDNQAPGTGRRLVESVDELLSRIRETPELYAAIHRDIRRAIVPRFPYGVFYRDLTDVVLVIGIVHLHRHPDTWKRR